MSGARPSSFSFSTAGEFRVYSTSELLGFPPVPWLVDGVLPEGAFGVIYGPPESYKSFTALDMALSVSSGEDWADHKVKAGPVLYVAGEGGGGLSKRVRAWLNVHDIQPQQTSMAWLPEAVDIYGESEDLDGVLRGLQTADFEPSLIVIDTLARCFNGDENKPEDMARFIKGIDRLRTHLDSTILIIHHTRVGGDRERGHSSLRGAADVMMSVEADVQTGQLKLVCDKTKDEERFADHTFQRVFVPEAKSIVFVPTDAQADKAVTVRAILEALKAHQPCDWSTWLTNFDGGDKVFYRHYSPDIKAGKLAVSKGGLWMLTQAGEALLRA